MAGVSFSYNFIGDNSRNSVDRLDLRLQPNHVSWTYNLNTSIQDTYGGQVIQVLSVNIDRLVLEGHIGRSGVFGQRQARKGDRSRFGGAEPIPGLAPKRQDEQWEDRTGKYGVGLTQMTEFFRNYFARASQGGDASAPGRYQYMPMTVIYAERKWENVIPVSFPSYKRSHENYAPEWRVEFEVLEQPDDPELQRIVATTALKRLKEGIGYTVHNPFSDPLAHDDSPATEILDTIASNFKQMIPGFTRGEIEEMIWEGISVPAVTQYKLPPKSLYDPEDISQYREPRSGR